MFTIIIQYISTSTHQYKFHFLLWSFHWDTDQCTYSHHGCFCKVDQACIHSACTHLHLIKKKKKGKNGNELSSLCSIPNEQNNLALIILCTCIWMYFVHICQSPQFPLPLAFNTALQIQKCILNISSKDGKREWTFKNSFIPMHFLPFSWYPGSQPQWKLPIVLKQRWWQELDSWHSLTSVEQYKSLIS